MSSPSLSRRQGLALLAGAAFLAGTTAARAAPKADAPPPGAPTGAPPGAPPGLNAGLLAVMRAGKTVPFATRAAMLTPAVDAAFNLPLILQVSVGPDWNKIAPAAQQALLEAFRRYTVASYVENFDSFDGQHFDLTPKPRPVPGGARVVLTRIVSRSGAAHQIDYVMRPDGTGWKAVDVLADGSISRVAVQRSDFAHLLRQGGAKALIASLERKVKDLAHG